MHTVQRQISICADSLPCVAALKSKSYSLKRGLFNIELGQLQNIAKQPEENISHRDLELVIVL